MKQKTSKTLQARDAAIGDLPSWKHIIRGTLVEHWRTCGNRGCRCYRGPRHRHGPYWYLAVSWERGRQKLYAIPKPLIPEVRRGVAAYRKLWAMTYRIAELNLALLKMRHGEKPG